MAKNKANINPYLVDGSSIVLANRTKPLRNSPAIGIGNYLFTPEEKSSFLEKEPIAATKSKGMKS